MELSIVPILLISVFELILLIGASLIVATVFGQDRFARKTFAVFGAVGIVVLLISLLSSSIASLIGAIIYYALSIPSVLIFLLGCVLLVTKLKRWGVFFVSFTLLVGFVMLIIFLTTQ